MSDKKQPEKTGKGKKCGCAKTSKAEPICPSRALHQNGKGDSPRNLSPGYRNNYDGISWKKQ